MCASTTRLVTWTSNTDVRAGMERELRCQGCSPSRPFIECGSKSVALGDGLSVWKEATVSINTISDHMYLALALHTGLVFAAYFFALWL